MLLRRQAQQQHWSQQQQWQQQQHRWPQLQQWRVQLQRMQQPPQWGPNGPGQYTHRVGAAATTRLVPAFVAGSGATSPTTRLSFTLDSGASKFFFRDCTDLTPLHTPVTVALTDPSVGSVVADSTTTLPCQVAPSGFLTGYYTPLFSRNLVGVSHLHDLGVVTTFPLHEPIASCTVGASGAPLATFHREPGSSLYSLHTGSHNTGSGQVRSGQVRSGLPESLAPLPSSPMPSCTPCVEGWQRAASHSSFPPTMAPLQTLHLDPPPVAPVAPPPSRPAPSGVSHVTPQSSPPQRPVPVVSGGAGGAVAEGEGTGAAGAHRASSGGAGGVRVETTPEEDTSVSTQRPRPATPLGFPSVPQFPPHSPPRSVAAEPGGVPARGTGVPGGVVGGGSGSRGAGAGDTSTATPTTRTVCSLTRVQCLDRLGREERDRRGGVTSAAAAVAEVSIGASGESRGGFTVVAAAPAAAEAASVRALGESRGGVTAAAAATAPAAAAAASIGASGESRGVTNAAAGVVAATAGEGRAGVPAAAAGVFVAIAGQSRGGATGAAGGAGAAAAVARGVHFLVPVDSSFSPQSCCVPRASPSSLIVFHDPLSDYLCASRLVVSRILSALVTHPTAPLSSVLALVTTVVGFASSHRLDYAAHLVSGPARSPFSGGAPVFPLEVLKDRQLELRFLAAAVPHLCAMLFAPEGDPNALDIPIPCNHAEAVSGPWASYWIAVE
ncbi:unnamed protein product [Closterium sp. NIES-53]